MQHQLDESHDVGQWWERPFRLVQTNLREEDADLDTSGHADLAKELGYDTWLCNAGGIRYFYPVTGPYQRSANALHRRPGGDLVGDAIEAAHQRSMKLVARFDFSRAPTEFVRENPDWAFIGADGEWYREDDLVGICPRSEYLTSFAPTTLDDFAKRYAVDGIFFNWLQWPEVAYSGKYKGVCHCERCRTAFAAAHPDLAHPAGVGSHGYREWLAVTQVHLESLVDRFDQILKKHRPGAAMLLADVTRDVAVLETNSSIRYPVPAPAAAKWWRNTPSELASANHTASALTPAIVHSSVNVGLPYRQIAEEPAHFRRYAAQALSRGAYPSTVFIGQIDDARFPCVRSVVDVLAFHRNHDDLYDRYRSAAEVAVVRPRGGPALNALQNPEDYSEYRGVFTALQEAHIPFDVLGLQFADRLAASPEKLDAYRVIVVTDVASCGTNFVDALEGYVERGGRLVLTGRTHDHAGLPVLSCSPSEGVIHGLAETVDLGGRYIGPIDPDLRVPLVPVLGTFEVVSFGADVEVGLVLSSQRPFGPPELTGGNSPDPASPALLRSNSVSLLPWAAGLTAWVSGLTHVQEVIVGEVVRLLDDALPWRFEASEELEITVGRADGAWVLHFVNHSGGRPDRARAPLPVRARVWLSSAEIDETASVTALFSGRRVEAVASPGGVYFDLAVDDVLEVVRVE